MEDWKQVELKDLLSNEEILDVELFIREKDWINLKIYLNKSPLKEKLKEKGVLADYLFYYLQASLK